MLPVAFLDPSIGFFGRDIRTPLLLDDHPAEARQRVSRHVAGGIPQPRALQRPGAVKRAR